MKTITAEQNNEATMQVIKALLALGHNFSLAQQYALGQGRTEEQQQQLAEYYAKIQDLKDAFYFKLPLA